MSEITRSKIVYSETSVRNLLWPIRRAKINHTASVLSHFGDLDDKTQKMLLILINEEFKTLRISNHVHFKLTAWVLRNKTKNKLKRMFDIFFAIFSCILFSPLILITAIVIKIESAGPIIYKQKRVGKNGIPFDCYKFRSMVVDADVRKQELMDKNEADEIVFKIKDDPRVTRVGKIIRKLSIDELPQLFNVLKGEMSIVGPRPPVPVEVENYLFSHFYRLDAVPGITGLQQVSGRSDVTFKRWIQLDLEYIEGQSFWKDIEIILRTIPAVILRKGAY